MTKTVMEKMGGKDWTLIKQNVGERVAGEKAKTAEREVERKAENTHRQWDLRLWCRKSIFVLIWKHLVSNEGAGRVLG